MKDNWLRNRVAKSAEEADVMDRVHKLLDERLAQRDALIRKFSGTPSASDVPARGGKQRRAGKLDGQQLYHDDESAPCSKCGCHKTTKRARIL